MRLSLREHYSQFDTIHYFSSIFHLFVFFSVLFFLFIFFCNLQDLSYAKLLLAAAMNVNTGVSGLP